MGGDNKTGKSKWSKVGSAAKTGAAALLMYPVIDAVADAAIGDTGFGKWAKKTTHLERELFPSIFGEPIKDVANKPSTNADIANLVNGINGQLNLKLDLTDNRPKLSVSKAPIGISVDPDTGIN